MQRNATFFDERFMGMVITFIPKLTNMFHASTVGLVPT
jgi:hypothetical protein